MPLPGDARPARSDASGRGALRAEAIEAAAGSAWLALQPEPFRNAVLSQAVLRRFSRGESITGLEDVGSDLYFLFTGSVQAAIARADGEVVATHVISRLEWFGAYGAVGSRRNIAEYRVTTPSLVLVVPRLVLMRGLNQPAAQGAVIDLLLDALKTHMEMAGDLTGLRSEHRVRSKLHALAGGAPGERAGRCVLHVSQDELAEVSCVSRSVVSKVISQLMAAGIVEGGYRRIAVLDRDRLLAPPDASGTLAPCRTRRPRRPG